MTWEEDSSGGVDWPLCVPPTVERDRRLWTVQYIYPSCFSFSRVGDWEVNFWVLWSTCFYSYSCHVPKFTPKTTHAPQHNCVLSWRKWRRRRKRYERTQRIRESSFCYMVISSIPMFHVTFYLLKYWFSYLAYLSNNSLTYFLTIHSFVHSDVHLFVALFVYLFAITRDKHREHIQRWRHWYLRDVTAAVWRSPSDRLVWPCVEDSDRSWSWPWREPLGPVAGPRPGRGHSAPRSVTASNRPVTTSSSLAHG